MHDDLSSDALLREAAFVEPYKDHALYFVHHPNQMPWCWLTRNNFVALVFERENSLQLRKMIQLHMK
jgi:hypothetical protein